ncbi:rhodanese-like domain-containing protein [Mycolicibacterium sp. 3033]|nr:rhodanese-like domain-containing protein [Mycolicibacterium aurantiacum]
MDHTGVRQAGVGEIPARFDTDSDGTVLLDVREHDEWRLGHAPGARHIPMSEVPARLAEIPADAELYVICHAGGRSQRVADYLVRNGYQPVNVSGGMSAWAGAGRPVVTDDGRPGSV